jgi:hypothetical protein
MLISEKRIYKKNNSIIHETRMDKHFKFSPRIAENKDQNKCLENLKMMKTNSPIILKKHAVAQKQDNRLSSVIILFRIFRIIV